jgi:hypothetical protein
MIAKLTKGKGFRGALNYLMQGKRDERSNRGFIIASNLSGTTPRAMAKEFGAFRQLRSRLGVAVCHTSLSLSPMDRFVDDEEFAQMAQRYLEAMGFEDCPFVAVRHHDTEHPHIHILASRIKPDGSVVSDKQDFQRAENIVRKLEEDFGLKAVPPSSETKQHRGTPLQQSQGGNTMKDEIRQRLHEAMMETDNLADFLAYCKQSNLTIVPHIQGEKVNGLVLRWKGQKFKASDIGDGYKWKVIAMRYAYKHDEHFHLLKALQEEDKPLVTTPAAFQPDQNEQQAREERRRLLDDSYVSQLHSLFPDEIREIKQSTYGLTVLTTDGGRLVDKGNNVQAEGMAEEDAARRIVAIGIAKGWEKICFTGSEHFICLAMAEAIKRKLPIVAKDEQQRQILEELLEREKGLPAMALTPQPSAIPEPEPEPVVTVPPVQDPQTLRQGLAKFRLKREQSQPTQTPHSPRRLDM